MINYTYSRCPNCNNPNININDEDNRQEVVRVIYSCECGWADEVFESKINPEYILNRVNKALDTQFEIYTWEDMLNDCDLTKEEKQWAKENISYKAYIIGE